jgi:hypothetical protein
LSAYVYTFPRNTTNRFSIVAVHGLGGDPFKTWEEANHKIWLRDFLPSQVPNARIMSYGYNSAVALSRSVAGIDEFATDLLVRLSDERKTEAVSQIPRKLYTGL